MWYTDMLKCSIYCMFEGSLEVYTLVGSYLDLIFNFYLKKGGNLTQCGISSLKYAYLFGS